MYFYSTMIRMSMVISLELSFKLSISINYKIDAETHSVFHFPASITSCHSLIFPSASQSDSSSKQTSPC